MHLDAGRHLILALPLYWSCSKLNFTFAILLPVKGLRRSQLQSRETNDIGLRCHDSLTKTSIILPRETGVIFLLFYLTDLFIFTIIKYSMFLTSGSAGFKSNLFNHLVLERLRLGILYTG